jgi:Cupin domain
VHTFRNVSDATVAFLNIHAPNVGFAEMLRAARDGRDADAEEFDQFEPPFDGGRPPSDAVLRGPGEGEPIMTGGTSAILKTDGSDVDGFFSLVETILAPGFRNPVRARDGALVAGFYVLEGTLSLRLGDEKLEVRSGDLALALPATVHSSATLGGERVRMLSLMAPAPSSLT